MLVKLIILFFYLSVVNSESKCGEFKTCSQCISYASEKCIWCSEVNAKIVRCQPEVFKSDSKWCNASFISNPENEIKEIERKTIANSKSLPSQSTDDHGRKITFEPAQVKLKLRPGVPVQFTLVYEPKEHFPLDVYFLMDNSYTMETYQKELKSQANNILTELNKFTKNVQLGFGTFVEKPGYPYYDKNRKQISVTYVNILSLTRNTSILSNIVNDLNFGSNFDDREAGLDALVQVMACTEIGWRKEARRIIVLFTDSSYHSAGDGKMIGIIKPNDMECHLKDNIYKEEAMKQDYPSVSQVDKMATKGNFKIIFATKASVSSVYDALSRAILGSETAILAVGESNTLEIIKNAYLEAESVVKLVHEAEPPISVTFDPDCNANNVKNCKSTHIKPNVEVNVTIVAESCLGENSSTKFKIKPFGLHDIEVDVALEVNCECECEKKEKVQSPACSTNSYLLCGVCVCNNSNNVTSQDTKSVECNSRGKYDCGYCSCNPGYSGKTCEYDDNLCLRECRGGNCTLGQCTCPPGWALPNCMCPDHNRDCIAPWSDNNEICFGNGNCACGQCVCGKVKDKNETYFGSFCDICPECATKYCKIYEEYVYCNYMKDKKTCDEKYHRETTIVRMVNATDMTNDNGQATWCSKLLDDGTSILFKYHYEDKILILTIQKEKQVPHKANLFVVIGSVVSAIVLIGLLTVIGWKVLTDIYDQREFKKVEEAAIAAGFDVSINPHYENPTSEFPNPCYSPNTKA